MPQDTFQEIETRQRYIMFLEADEEVGLMDASLYKERSYQMASVRRDRTLCLLLDRPEFKGVWSFT